MSDSHAVLGVAPNADEQTIRKRYLALVREFPPDRAPERFKEIRAAYERLSNPVDRWEQALFSPTGDDSVEAIAAEARRQLCGQRIALDVLLSLGED